MTTLVVGDGEYKTIGAALAAAAAGDEVIVRPGVYRESVNVNKAVTLRGEPGAIVDGGWDGKSKTDTFGGTIAINARGATVDRLTAQNCPGRGIALGSGAAVKPITKTKENPFPETTAVTIRDCVVRNCYKGGIGANPPAGMVFSELIVDGNLIVDVGLERHVTGKGNVNGSLLFTDVVDSFITNNTVVGGLGEGINVDRNTRRCLFEGNAVINCAHAHIYVNCAQENVIRHNIIIYSARSKPVGQATAPAGILIGDEHASRLKFDPSAGNVITENIVIGTSPLFQVRNNDANYDTRLDGTTKVFGNTFVAGPLTERGVDIAPNTHGRPHEAAQFAGNVIEFGNAAPGGVIAARADAALDFHHNGWSVAPTKDVRGDGDVIGPLGLVNPAAPLAPDWGTPSVGYDAANYRPAAGSPLIGAGFDGGTIGALAPAAVDPPDEPEPEPDYTWLFAALAAQRERLEDAGLAVGTALVDLDLLIELVNQTLGEKHHDE
jgi:hypothetical protein